MPENVDPEDFYRYVARHENSQRRSGPISSTPLPENSDIDDIFGTLSVTESTTSNPRGFPYTQEHSTIAQRQSLNHQPSSQEHFYAAGARSHLENQLPFQHNSSQITISENSASPPGLLSPQISDRFERSARTLQQPVASRELESSILDPRSPISTHREGTSLREIETNVISTAQSKENSGVPVQSNPTPPNPFRRIPQPVLPSPPPNEVFTVGPGSKYQWNISEARFKEWVEVHRRWSGDIDVLTGENAVKRFKESGLDPRVLGEIWGIADTDNTGFLTSFQFQVAMHLITACKAGHGKRALDPEVIANLRDKLSGIRLDTTSQVSPTLTSIDTTAVAAGPYTRAQYEEGFLEALLPLPEEVVREMENSNQLNRTPPSAQGDPFRSIDNSVDLLDIFDDNDLSDDADILSHRITYYRERVISFFREGKYSDALVELGHCEYGPSFSFRILVVKAMLQNLDRNNAGDGAVAGVTLAKTTYSPQDGVLANLLLYFTRALSRYHFGSLDKLAFEDCKRGLKLAKLANIQPQDQLPNFVKSDLAELAAVITLKTNARADTHFYRAMVRENHETHYFINAVPERIVLSPLENKQGREFLSKYGILVNDELVLRGYPKNIVAAFDSALSERNFPACYLLAMSKDLGGGRIPTITNRDLVEQNKGIYIPLFGRATIYPPTFLHFIASYPETKFGPFIATELIKSGISVHATLDPGPAFIKDQQDSGRRSYGYYPPSYTPLGFATIFNNIPLMDALINSGARMERGLMARYPEFTFSPSPVYLATYFAAAIGSLDPLKYLLKERKPDVLDTDSTGSEYTDGFSILERLSGGYIYNSIPLQGNQKEVDIALQAFQMLVTEMKAWISDAIREYDNDPFGSFPAMNIKNAWESSLKRWRRLISECLVPVSVHPPIKTMIRMLEDYPRP
ncbi:hypothetical protein TWF281_007988 [Arthrobotrys megalospora]